MRLVTTIAQAHERTHFGLGLRGIHVLNVMGPVGDELTFCNYLENPASPL